MQFGKHICSSSYVSLNKYYIYSYKADKIWIFVIIIFWQSMRHQLLHCSIASRLIPVRNYVCNQIWITEALRVEVTYPDSMVHGAHTGPIWGRQDPDGPNVGPINFAIWIISMSGAYAS